MDSSALPEVVMGSTFTLCCTAAPPLPLCLESTLHLTSRHLLQPHRHGQTGTGHLPSLATLEDEFPTLPSPRGHVQTLHPPGATQPLLCLWGVHWVQRHWVYISPLPLRARRETRACSHTGGRNGSLTLPRNCANCCAWELLDRKLGDWVLPGVTSAGGNPCCRCLRGFALRGLRKGERI